MTENNPGLEKTPDQQEAGPSNERPPYEPAGWIVVDENCETIYGAHADRRKACKEALEHFQETVEHDLEVLGDGRFGNELGWHAETIPATQRLLDYVDQYGGQDVPWRRGPRSGDVADLDPDLADHGAGDLA